MIPKTSIVIPLQSSLKFIFGIAEHIILVFSVRSPNESRVIYAQSFIVAIIVVIVIVVCKSTNRAFKVALSFVIHFPVIVISAQK